MVVLAPASPTIIAVAACVAVPELLLVQPVDALRILQQQPQPHAVPLRTFVASPRIWFRGFVPAAVGMAPRRTVFWAAWQTRPSGWRRSSHATVWHDAAYVATLQTVVDCPFANWQIPRITQLAAPRRLYQGLLPHWGRNALFVAIWLHLHHERKLGLVAATSAAVLASQPLDLMKTRMQSGGRAAVAAVTAREFVRDLVVATPLRIVGCCLSMGIGEFLLPSVRQWLRQ